MCRNSRLFTVCIGLPLVLFIKPIAAQESADRLTAEIEALKRTVQTLEARLQAMESKRSSAEAAASTKTPKTAAHSQSSADFKIYGFTQLDAIQDFGRVDSNWEATLRPTRIPTTPGLFGGDGKFIGSVRQTRLGIESSHGNFHVKFEFDLFGVGNDQGQTTLRLRHAYGQYRQWLAGQTDSLFMDGDVFPNTIDYWGPDGMAYLRTPQVRWTPITGADTFAVAIEAAASDIDTGRFGREFPDFGAAAEGRDDLPDLTAQYRMNRDWGHFQAAGILRKVAFETAGTPDNRPRGDDTGWGLNLTSNIKFGDKDRLILAALGGQGIASYMNDGGSDLIPDDSAPGVIPEAVAMPLWASVLYYDHWWRARWSSSIGYSFIHVDNSNNQEASAFKKGEYSSINLLHYPTENMMVGGEFLWGKRTDNDGATGSDTRLQISFKYQFSSDR